MFRKFRFSPEAYPATLYFIYAQKSNSTPLKKKKKRNIPPRKGHHCEKIISPTITKNGMFPAVDET